MNKQQKIKKKLQDFEKFNDPVMLMMIFLSLPGVIIATIFIKQCIKELQSQLKVLSEYKVDESKI